MAKLKKRKKNKNKNHIASVSPDTLAVQGQGYLKAGNFSKAIETFKHLLKIEPRAEWQKRLAEAYLWRSRILSSKGMYKEALVLLDNLTAFCGAAVPVRDLTVPRLVLLMNSGQYEKAALLWQKESDRSGKTPQAERLSDLFAALILGGETGILEKFAEDAPLVQHYPFARDALKAFCCGQDDRVDQSLSGISFRSPYKNFRLVLKGLRVVNSDSEAANRFFDKIPPDSPFFSLVKPLIGFCNNGYRDLSSLLKMNRQELALLASLTGVEPDRLDLLIRLHAAADNPKKQFELLSLKGRQIDQQAAKNASLNLLPSVWAGVRIYENAFGPVSVADRYRLEALRYEQQQEPEFALDYWQRLVNHLVKEPDSADTSLSIALIYRHMAELIEKMGDCVDEYGYEYDDPHVQSRYYFEKSLIYDPADKAVYLKLIDMCRHETREMRKWVESALKFFPEDVDILLVATELALKSLAFKKASRFAEKILQIDPINTRVRTILFEAHLAHGRKSANAGKFDLAVKEFSLADENQRSNLQKGTAVICRGLTEILRGSDKAATALLAEGQQIIGSERRGWVITAVEAYLLKLTRTRQNQILGQLKKCNKITPDREEIFNLVAQVASYPSLDSGFIVELFSILKPVFKKSARLGFSQQEMQYLCDFFHKNYFFDLLRSFAGEALKSWPDLPVYTFYTLYGKCKGNPGLLDSREFQDLEHAADVAVEQHDPHAAKMIDEFIGFLRLARRFSDDNLYDDDEDDDDEDEDLFDVPGGRLFDELLEMLGDLHGLGGEKKCPRPHRRPVKKKGKKLIEEKTVEEKPTDLKDKFKFKLPGKQRELF